ncbi:MAG: 50S ribosomal protein L24 [Nitrososphaerales archaeon]
MKKTRISSKPTKVRKRLFTSPLHTRNARQPRAAFSSDLSSKYGRNSVRVRIGDSVRLLRGEYSGIEGKVLKVFPKHGLVTVEGITREKIAGGTTPVRLHTSNLIVTSLNLDDRWRREKIEGSQ